MQDILGSVRRSLVFRTPPDNEEGGSTLVDKMNSFIRKSRVFSKPSSPILLPPVHKEDPPPPPPADDAPPIRWRKGELIGCGAFGRVYMGMNLDSGELLAVKQVMIAAHSASNEKAQAHIRELEEEVNLLKNLSHPNIVRYLGTVREEESLNILLEFVPGGSISSLLGKFGPFPEPVIKTYTKQLLLGLEYLHKHGIMHRDIKGANILVDNKGCIKLADFGASKQVVELATVTGAKSLKGTPYWMAPEVVHQTGHNISADIWSVGCTVIEMVTGKPPWSDQYQGVAVLFHIGNSESLPPIPEHLSVAAKDFLLKCLQRDPNMRPSACELLQHPFVTGERAKPHSCSGSQTSFMENPETPSPSNAANLRAIQMTSCNGSEDLCNLGSLSCSTVFPVKLTESKHIWGANDVDGEMCRIDENDDFMVSDVKLNSVVCNDFNKSFNPMCEPFDDWRCSPDEDLEPEHRRMDLDTDQAAPVPTGCSSASGDGDNDFSFPCGPSISEDDDELTESKITAFLDEKALELKKLQTPLYEEFYNSLNTICSPAPEETTSNFLKLPPKSKSPSRGPIGTSPSAADPLGTASPGSNNRRVSNVGSPSNQMSHDTPPLHHNDRKGLIADAQQETSPSVSFSEIQRKWKEELDQELERKREMMRQAGVGGKTSSPKDRPPNRPKTRFASPGK